MRCAECEQILSKRAIHLKQGDEQSSFCSHECVIAYSVQRIRLRIAHQNRRVRFMARQQLRPGAVNAHENHGSHARS
jgi:hypothetical protein